MKNIIKKAVDPIIIILSATVFIFYFFYAIGGTMLSDHGGLFITVTVFILTTLPIIFAKFLKRVLGKFFIPLKILYFLGLLIYIVLFSLFSIQVMSLANEDVQIDDGQAVVIICGCKCNGYEPSEALRSRLEKGHEILVKYPESVCIVSGGMGDDETISEAECMRSFLVSLGIDEARIIKEDRSRSTNENILFSIEKLKENNIDISSTIIIVTSDFHTFRASTLAKENNLSPYCVGADTPFGKYLLRNLVREFMYFVYNLIFR